MTDSAHDIDDLPRPPARVRDLADLDAFWRWVAGPYGYSVPQLFGIVVDADGTPLPTIINVKNDPGRPAVRIDDELVSGLVATLTGVVGDCAPGGSVALMWARPGAGSSRLRDREALRRLHLGLASAPFDTWPVFFATDDSTGVVPPDELIAALAG